MMADMLKRVEGEKKKKKRTNKTKIDKVRIFRYV